MSLFVFFGVNAMLNLPATEKNLMPSLFLKKTIARFFSRPIVQIVIWVAVLETLGSLSSLFSMPGPWYVQLSKSTLTPPSYVFPIAWTILYALLGFYGWSLWHYYSSPRVLKNVFVVQMLFNLSWSTIFFEFQNVSLALLSIAVMILLTVYMTIKSMQEAIMTWPVLIPYLGWLIFAYHLTNVIFSRL